MPQSRGDRGHRPDPPTPTSSLCRLGHGGIWRTTNASAASPNWTPLIDDFPGLSIGAIAISPRDHNTIFAGVGRSSSDAGEGGSLTGLLKSTDGGDTWSLVGRQLRGLNVRQLVAQAGSGPEVVLAATDDGLFRSTNGGSSFTSVLAGNFTDLARDTGNSSRFFAARIDGSTAGGVFRSEDSGATWTRIDQGFMNAATAVNIKLAIHRQVGDDDPLYAGIVGPNGQLRGVFRARTGRELTRPCSRRRAAVIGSFVGIHLAARDASISMESTPTIRTRCGRDRQPFPPAPWAT